MDALWIKLIIWYKFLYALNTYDFVVLRINNSMSLSHIVNTEGHNKFTYFSTVFYKLS